MGVGLQDITVALKLEGISNQIAWSKQESNTLCFGMQYKINVRSCEKWVCFEVHKHDPFIDSKWTVTTIQLDDYNGSCSNSYFSKVQQIVVLLKHLNSNS